MHPTIQVEQATRRTQVMETLAEAVATLDRPPPIHVTVDGFSEPSTRTLADDLARVLADRGRRCGRVTLDALSLLHPAQGWSGPATAPGPATTWCWWTGASSSTRSSMAPGTWSCSSARAHRNPPDPTRTLTGPRPRPATSPRSTPRASPTSSSTCTTRAGR